MTTTQLSFLIGALTSRVENRNIDTRLIHRIKSFSQALGEATYKEIDILVDEFDNYVNDEDGDGALQIMERLLGLLEGSADRLGQKASDQSGGALLPQFSLEEADKQRVLKLCADIRKIVLATNDFDHPHKIRLSNRIAAIEAEIHKKKGMFDVILGGVADFGETLKKFGKDIKPLTDRINEIRRIAQEGTPEYDQIPAPEETKRITKQPDID